MHDVQGSSMLLPLLRSPFQGEFLALLYLNPDREFSAIDIAKRCGVSHATASREADRFMAAGLVSERRLGNMRLLRASVDTIVAGPLTDLLAVTYGPMAVVGELLTGIPGVDLAFIYGSWAARYNGLAGPVPRDVDVLVVGDPDADDLYEAERVASARLNREVTIRRVSSGAWRGERDDPFVLSVRSQPLIALDIGDR
jgi:DNA-binding transcriptional ArsR family regulator